MKYSWKEEWLYGATSSMPTLEITLKQDQIRYKCPFVFGGIEQAQVWYRDVDGDGVPDIVFGHGNEKIIVVFLPQAHAAPKFRLIRSDVLFNGEAGNVQEGKRF